jgi:hypothetical protein
MLESNSQEKEQPVEEVERPTPAVVERVAPVALPRGHKLYKTIASPTRCLDILIGKDRS